MKFIITISFIFLLCSCSQSNTNTFTKHNTSINKLDSLKSARFAEIIFHSQNSKMSVVVKEITNLQSIDTIISYIGNVNEDTSCLQAGDYNYFGEIYFYKTASSEALIAEMHFVLQGECESFYLQTKNFLKRYDMTLQGKEFLMQLRNQLRDFD